MKRSVPNREVQLNEERNYLWITIVTNRVPLYVEGEIVGAIPTFRDKTEIRKLAGNYRYQAICGSITGTVP